MTEPKRWPKNINASREECIAQARAINCQVQPLLELLERRQVINPFELALRLGKINDAAHRIVHELAVTAPLEFKKE